MANQGGGGPGLAPPPPPPQDQQQAAQHSLQQSAPGAQQQQQGPPQAQPSTFAGYQAGAAVNGIYNSTPPSHGKTHVLTLNSQSVGYGPPQPPQTASPGPGKGRGNRAQPGPATPQQNHQVTYPDPRASPQVARPTPPGAPIAHRTGNNLLDLEIEQLPPNQKKEGADWFAVFNPDVPRVLDVDLVHHLVHDSVVCCVRFSADGKYVATGCNHSAQIFDVGTGQLISTLQDDSVDKDGDLYIRSVCFSPDGRYLATGAEDKQIRVNPHISRAFSSLIVLGGFYLLMWLLFSFGILPTARSNISFLATSRTFTLWISLAMDATSHLVAATRPFASGILSISLWCTRSLSKMV